MENKQLLFGLSGGLAMSIQLLIVQAMNPINVIAKDIYRWSDEDANQFYGLASSLVLISGFVMMLMPSYLIYIHYGRLNSIRLVHFITISGCSIMLIRNTAALLIGRIICGLAVGISLFNSIPYVIVSVPNKDKYFIGSIAITISKIPPLIHAILSLIIEV